MPASRRALAFLAGTVIAWSFAACGDEDEPEGANAKRFSGEEGRVAAVVDELQEASRKGDAERICDDLFTDKLAGVISVRAGGSPCEEPVRKRQVRKDAEIRVLRLRTEGNNAVVDVEEQNGNRTTMKLLRQGDAWRIDSIAATEAQQ